MESPTFAIGRAVSSARVISDSLILSINISPASAMCQVFQLLGVVPRGTGRGKFLLLEKWSRTYKQMNIYAIKAKVVAKKNKDEARVREGQVRRSFRQRWDFELLQDCVLQAEAAACGEAPGTWRWNLESSWWLEWVCTRNWTERPGNEPCRGTFHRKNNRLSSETTGNFQKPHLLWLEKTGRAHT